jgi:hypothetical protein
VLVTKNKEGSFKIQGDISKLKKGFKVKVTGHVKGIGDDATMEDNTPQQLAIDLKSFLPEGEQPRKVSTIGCSSDVCDKGGKSFVSNLKESLLNDSNDIGTGVILVLFSALSYAF